MYEDIFRYIAPNLGQFLQTSQNSILITRKQTLIKPT